jgi:nucleoside-diphosphate-sugar epimerase
MAERILVTGAFGFVGGHLLTRLLLSLQLLFGVPCGGRRLVIILGLLQWARSTAIRIGPRP